jgi:hypothetical protein
MAAYLRKIKNWFGGTSVTTPDRAIAEAQIDTNPAFNQVLSKEEPAPIPSDGVPALLEAPIVTNPDLKIPNWLEDEEILRDEGVLFGLSESEPTEKTDIIHKYFSHLSAIPLRKIEELNEQIQEFNLFIEQKSNRLTWLDDQLNAAADSQIPQEHQLPRIIIGLTLSVAMCFGNFFLIESSLQESYTNPTPIAFGIFLAGMFSLFGKISLFHDTESKLSWRALLEEVGIPLAASLFIFSKVLPTQGIFEAICLFIFIFFLFLFTGKLLLSNVTVLRRELASWNQMRVAKLESQKQREIWQHEKNSLETEVANLRVRKWQLLKEQNQAESERDQLFARRDMLIKIFESEFYLARRMKHQLSKKQLDLIQDHDSSLEI